MKRNAKRSKNTGGVRPIRFRQSLFWDVDPKTIDPKRHARYIIERILELGNDEEVHWMWNAYSQQLIRNVAEKSRALSPHTKTLWRELTIQK